uniref:RING-type domain-containing protein n=1 Tax=Haptolina brevifila TaxID=156173 RepID=A0A7S2MF07_9EUKA|mmetsp:Transcript_50946/g.101314  ORF Transcript_50946/g.101314 Transcript_50946/m.101314 type:complete len:346 (+) Transcript_50946:17-1054(+)
MDHPPSRDVLQARQRAWMQQRQAEMDRKQAVRSLGSVAAASGSGSGGGSSVDNAAVLDRLAVQIAERLQVEVRRENAKAVQDGAQVESLIERHISSHTCPICYELMAGKEHQPTLLFPCGHTFCAACLRMHLEKLDRKTCPYCRETVSSQAPNISLAQVIDGFVERQQSVSRGEVMPELLQGAEAAAQPKLPRQPYGAAPAGVSASALEAEIYAEQFRAFSMRSRVMRNQLEESRLEVRSLSERRQTAERVLEHLKGEAAAAAERLEAVRLELEVIEAQKAEQEAKVEQIACQQRNVEQMEGMVGQTHGQIEAERQRALLLVRNFNPSLADELQLEYDADLAAGQ